MRVSRTYVEQYYNSITTLCINQSLAGRLMMDDGVSTESAVGLQLIPVPIVYVGVVAVAGRGDALRDACIAKLSEYAAI